MEIRLEQVGKRFVREWIFRNLSLHLQPGDRLALTGPNGSGKSTLLQVLAGAMPPTAGKIDFLGEENRAIEEDDRFRQLVIAAPYLELVEEFTLTELVDFHRKFKPFLHNRTTQDFIEYVDLQTSAHKYIRNFSSGMKQRLRLGLAFWADVPLLLLDEPTANLDARTTAWYLSEVQRLPAEKIIVVGSNVAAEYGFCSRRLNLPDHR